MTGSGRYKLANVTAYAYAFENRLLISSNDDNIITLAGDDVPIVKRLIGLFQEIDNSESVFDIVKNEFDVGVNLFYSLVDYLVRSCILVPISAGSNNPDHVNIKAIVIGQFPEEECASRLFIKLNKSNLSYNITSISNSFPKIDLIREKRSFDLVILVSPILQHTASIFEFSKYLEVNNIPVIHAGIENYSLIVGPLLDATLSTPSLSCYFRRKLASFKKPNVVLSAFKSQNLTTLIKQDISKEPLIDLLFEFIGLELEKYFLTGSSNILGKEIEIDCLRYQSRSTKIFKTHFFEDGKTVNPFSN